MTAVRVPREKLEEAARRLLNDENLEVNKDVPMAEDIRLVCEHILRAAPAEAAADTPWRDPVSDPPERLTPVLMLLSNLAHQYVVSGGRCASVEADTDGMYLADADVPSGYFVLGWRPMPSVELPKRSVDTPLVNVMSVQQMYDARNAEPAQEPVARYSLNASCDPDDISDFARVNPDYLNLSNSEVLALLNAAPVSAPQVVTKQQIEDAWTDVLGVTLFHDGVEADLAEAGITAVADAYVEGRMDAANELKAALEAALARREKKS